MRDKDGNRLYKSVTVKLFPPEGHRRSGKVFHAPAKRGYGPSDVEELKTQVIEWADKEYPYWNFRLVDIGPNSFNLVYDGLREESGELNGTAG